MYCLFNGKYGEHELNVPSLEVCLDNMEKNYAKWPGTVVGDFECLTVKSRRVLIPNPRIESMEGMVYLFYIIPVLNVNRNRKLIVLTAQAWYNYVK